MGSKSSNTIKTKEMLPLFRVISDLEKPDTPTDSIVCSNVDKSAENVQNETLSDFSAYRRSLELEPGSVDNVNVSNCEECNEIRESEYKLHKKRRRLKENSTEKKLTKYKTVPDIRSISDVENYFESLERRRIGMFTTMAINMYEDKNIDLSRHFQDLSQNEIEEERKSIQKTDCPIYEDPKDTIKTVKRTVSKKKKKKIADTSANGDNTNTKARRLYKRVKISKKDIIKKYEHMLTIMLEKSRQKDTTIKEKDFYMKKMKNKLKEILQYNHQFADENDYLKSCVEQYKHHILSLESNRGLHSKFEATNPSVCSRCNNLELLEKENVQLVDDLTMLKNVVYKLNVQLSQYQDKFQRDRSSEKDSGHENVIQAEVHDDKTYIIEGEGKIDWGDVNTHTLAPLLNAYQESLNEKDDLISDYEKEFVRFTNKLKEIVQENDDLHGSSSKVTSELITLRETCGLAVKERDELRKENSALKERIDEFERKIKDIHDCYEHKVEAMSRDYTLIHQEYFKTKTGLATVQGRCQVLEDYQKNLQTENLIPTKVHTLRIDECRKLFDELKNRYEIDRSKSSGRIKLLEDSNASLEKKYLDASNDRHNMESKLKANERLLKKCRHMLLSYRKDITALKTSRDIFKRRSTRAIDLCKQLAASLEQAAGDERFQHLKTETLNIQKGALKELDALESKMKRQDMMLHKLKENNQVEINKLENILREKDATIEAMKRHVRGDRLQRFTSPAETPAEILKAKKGFLPDTPKKPI